MNQALNTLEDFVPCYTFFVITSRLINVGSTFSEHLSGLSTLTMIGKNLKNASLEKIKIFFV